MRDKNVSPTFEFSDDRLSLCCSRVSELRNRSVDDSSWERRVQSFTDKRFALPAAIFITPTRTR